MCGIAGGAVGRDAVERALDLIAHRGPDGRAVHAEGCWTVGHVRLAVVDLDPRSDQPMTRGATTVAYNGECWNHAALRSELEAAGQTFSTPGDTEVVATALDEWGEAALPRMEGMFAVAWTCGDGTVRLARDRFGEVPLHVGRAAGGPVFASELAGLLALGAAPSTVRWVPPGCVVELGLDGSAVTRPYRSTVARPADVSAEEAAAGIVDRLAAACRERAMTDVPAACLASGGLDSSAVALLLKPWLPALPLYTAVLDPRSSDLRAAREVAGFLDLPLVEVKVEPPTAADLARVVEVIEQPSKAQVEIAWACLALADALHADGIKVVFSGEGSDELWASYGSSFHGVKAKGWYDYRVDTFVGQHRKNFPRCNKAFARSSVEARLPFLHSGVVDWALGLPRSAVAPKRDKQLMRDGFRGLLPDRVLTRAKEAFQTAAGLDDAAAAAVADPARFYRAEFARRFRGVAA